MIGKHTGRLMRSDGSTYLKHLYLANTFWSRFRGLQFLPKLPSGTGLLLTPCRSVHTFWMRFPIHVIFLDSDYKVLEYRESVSPWSLVTPHAKGIVSTLEVPVDKQLPEIGEQFEIIASA